MPLRGLTHEDLRRSYRRIAVARTYVFRGTFVVDVLSALPLGALGRAFGGGTGADGALALKLLRLPRLLRLSRLLRKARDKALVATHLALAQRHQLTHTRAFNVQLENMSSATMFRVGLLVNAYVLIGHWAACIFFYLSKWQARAATRRAVCAAGSDAAPFQSFGTQLAAGQATALGYSLGS